MNNLTGLGIYLRRDLIGLPPGDIRMALLLLHRCQMVREVLDALLHDPFVLLIVIAKDRAPRSHVRRAVSRRPRPKLEDPRYIFVWELTGMTS